MPLDPGVINFFAEREAMGARATEELSVPEAREQSIRLNAALPRPEVARVRDIEMSSEFGTIPARLYYPGQAQKLPVLVFFHGGGFVLGDLETTDPVCRQWTNGTGCLLVSVNYRHAPEHKFPAAAHDAYAATRWVSEHASEIGGDPSRIAVSGMSAGGNLAAVAAIMARDRGGPPIAFQLLWVPVLDSTMDTTSYRENAEGYGLTRAGMAWFWGHYLSDPADGVNPYASPAHAPDLSNLPSAFIVAAQYDPLRDEALAYADRLKRAGNRVEVRYYEGMVHGFLGPQATSDAFAHVRRALDVA